MARDLDIFKKQRIVELVENGATYREVSQVLGVGLRTIWRWIRRHRENEGLEGKRRNCGRRAELSERQERVLIRSSEYNPFKTAVDLKRELDLPVSVQSVRRYLRVNGLLGRIAAQKEHLTEEQRQTRLEFAEHHQHTHWVGVLFSDEKSFCRGSCGQIRVRRPCKERFNPKYIKSVRRSGRFSVNVWAFMTDEGPGEIHRIQGNLNAIHYIQILQGVLRPSVQDKLPVHMVQDRSPIHTANIVKTWFQENTDIRLVLNWPTKGADFNPIENMWAEMAKMIDGAICVNQNELWRQIWNAWTVLKDRQDYFRNLVASMPSRFQKAVEKRGGWTGY